MPPIRTRQPQRTCIACRDTSDKRGLTRIVRSTDGHVTLDTAGRKPGRGAYLCEKPQCWERALGRSDGLARALRGAVPPEDRAALLAQAPTANLETEIESGITATTAVADVVISEPVSSDRE